MLLSESVIVHDAVMKTDVCLQLCLIMAGVTHQCPGIAPLMHCSLQRGNSILSIAG